MCWWTKHKLDGTKLESLKKIIDEENVLDGHKEGENGSFKYITSDDEACELYGIFYQNNHMRRLYSAYGSTMFFDFTYEKNTSDYPTLNMCVLDNNLPVKKYQKSKSTKVKN